MDEEKQIETGLLIERYLDDRMTSEERSAFESRVKLESDLAAEVEKHRAINFMVANMDAVPLSEEDKQKSKAAYQQAQLLGKRQKVRRLYRAALAVAAVALILIVTRLFIFPPAENLLVTYQEKYMQPRNLMGGNPLLSQGSTAFQNGKYEEAIEAYAAYLQENPGQPPVMRALVFSYMANHQPQEALPYIDQLPEGDLTDWYRILAYLSMEDEQSKATGETLLEQLIAAGNSPALLEDARKLLESLH